MKAPTYGLDRNGRPYDNPRYKFYANGDIDGDYWMCVYKPTGTIFAVPFPKPGSKVPISQLVYMAFPGDDAEDAEGVNDSGMVVESSHDDEDEREGGANMLLGLQLSSPVLSSPVLSSPVSSSTATYYSSFDNLFVGLQDEVATRARKRLCEHLIDPDTIFDSFDTIQPDIREQIVRLVLDDINCGTFAYQIVESRVNALL